MTTLTIDGKEVSVEPGTTILQACRQLNIEIPVFCYHERLSVAGNCRMCLVEVEKSPKPVASCTMSVMEGMVVHTQSKETEKARKGTLEFLLINHPLDCPICDQGGECDLQDLTINYGRGDSRFKMNKRAVTDKYMGPLVNTVMTRCIHCTRCVRFSNEIAGVDEIGILHRGEHAEITSYLEGALKSELSGNVIDLCPVGALTSKPYAYHGRPWELEPTDSVDVHDALGSHIRIDTAHRKVMRIVPRVCEEINQEWLDDRSRFACDGLAMQRLDKPYVRVNGKLKATTWNNALERIAKEINNKKGSEIAALTGPFADCESQLALKRLMDGLKSKNYDCRSLDAQIPIENPAHFLFNSQISGIDKMDVLLLIGTNPRHEAAILNARIGDRVRKGELKVALVGKQINLSYPYEYLGDKPTVLGEIADGKHAFSKLLENAENPALIMGVGATQRRDSSAVFEKSQAIAHKFKMIRKGWNGFNLLHLDAATVGGMLLGLTNQTEKGTADILEGASSGRIKVLYLLGFDSLPKDYKKNSFIIYQGHHGDEGAQLADVILPGAAYTEKDATFVNTEGRIQKTTKAVDMPGDAKTDWRIIRALAEPLGVNIAINDDDEMQSALTSANNGFASGGLIPTPEWSDFKAKTPQRLSTKAFTMPIENFYMANVIAKNSPTMAKCVKEILEGRDAA